MKSKIFENFTPEGVLRQSGGSQKHPNNSKKESTSSLSIFLIILSLFKYLIYHELNFLSLTLFSKILMLPRGPLFFIFFSQKYFFQFSSKKSVTVQSFIKISLQESTFLSHVQNLAFWAHCVDVIIND